MGEKTNISWTTSTFNPWWGCTRVSRGCDHCYAESLDKHWFPRNQETDVLIDTITTTEALHWGKGQPRRVMSDHYWEQPLKWDKAAKDAGVRHKVFCASMADVMDDEAPEGQRERLWALIEQTPHLIWQLLTKRPQRYAKYLPLFGCPNNIWLGTSAEDQANYNLRWPYLYRAAEARELTTFISYEPALGPLEMRQKDGRPNWLICGAESGANRRPMEQEWVENIRFECENDGVAFFMKQFGARTPEQGAQLIPAHLLVRQFPGGPA